MLSQIIKNINLASSYESSWFPTTIRIKSGKEKLLFAKSVQIYWENAISGASSNIQLLVANDISATTVLNTYTLQTPTNKANCLNVAIDPYFAYFKLKYNRVETTGGTLNAIVYYEERN